QQYKLIYSLLDDGRPNEVAVNYTKNQHPRKGPLAGCPTLEELENAPDAIKRVYHDWINPPKIQLYDLKNDPWEFNDLSADPNYDAVKERLLKELVSWQESTDDPLRFPDK